MTKEKAIRELPNYMNDEIPIQPLFVVKRFDKEAFVRRYGIMLALACFFTLYTIALTGITTKRTEKRVWAEAEEVIEQRIADYDTAQREARSAEYFLSGEASREAFVNQEIDAVAAVIAKLSTDPQKYTEAACMLARVMNPAYGDTFQEVSAQPQQWMFYDGTDKTFSQHDREIAENIVRPYLENGIIPNGLTQNMVYGSWSTNDFVLRDSYQTTPTMHTWRYS